MAKLKSPKQKGDAYERELAHFINEKIFGGHESVYRAPLSGGGRSFARGLNGDSVGGSADIIGTPDLWVEAKRTEKFSPYKAMEQAEAGIEGHQSDEFPTIINRRNRMKTGESLVCMRMNDWLKLYDAYLKTKGIK